MATLLGFLLLMPAGASSAEPGPAVAVAASLRHTMPDLVAAFREGGGGELRVSYGASGALTRQIRRGAPFALFLAANEAYPQRLIAAGRTHGSGAIYARGRVALYVPTGSPLTPDGSLGDLRRALADGRLERFAIAQPAHAPYGERARAVLKHEKLWQSVQPYLATGENAAQAAQFAATGAAEGALIPLALARSPRFARNGQHGAVPAAWHPPLKHRMVRLPDAGARAQRFYRFMRQPKAQTILEANGFAPAEPAG